MTELQIEHNAHFDFSMVGDDGRELTPAYGPGRTGIRNLGNSCYLASTMQALVALPAFRARFNDVNLHAAHCPRSPAACLECQMRKLVDGLVSGRYAAGNVPLGVKPTMLKDVLGHGHPEFASMRQQDADEFLKHVVTAVQTLDGPDPTRVFAYTLEHRLECGECHRVRYTEEYLDVGLALPVPVTPVGNGYAPVALADCLARFTRSESLTYRCPACCRDVEAIKQTRFATFPDVLIVQAQRFQLQNWVPQKVNVPLIVPLNVALDLSAYAACGVQPGEEMLPDSEEPEFDMGTLGDLTAMGFSENRAKRALQAAGPDVEAAVNWLFERMDDASLDAPLRGAILTAPDTSSLEDMGFSRAQAAKALRLQGSIEGAVTWLFENPDDPGETENSSPSAPTPRPGTTVPGPYHLASFISHRGPSVHSGHYVAHVHAENAPPHEGWTFFNDEKVVEAPFSEGESSVTELSQLAYLYVFIRK